MGGLEVEGEEAGEKGGAAVDTGVRAFVEDLVEAKLDWVVVGWSCLCGQWGELSG